jgi:excisionase family DNA binding protein
MPEALLIPVSEAAPLLGISRHRAYELARANLLPGLRKLGARQYRVSVAELEAFLGAAVQTDPVESQNAGAT